MTPPARLTLPGACAVGWLALVLFGTGCSGSGGGTLPVPPLLNMVAPKAGSPADEGYGWRPDPAVNARAAELYDGPDPAKREAAYNKAYFEYYHSTPDNAVADWQIAKRMDELLKDSGNPDDPKKKKEAYRKAYFEVWGRLPPPGHPIPDTHLWIDPSSPQERERQELGLDRPSKGSKVGTK